MHFNFEVSDFKVVPESQKSSTDGLKYPVRVSGSNGVSIQPLPTVLKNIAYCFIILRSKLFGAVSC